MDSFRSSNTSPSMISLLIPMSGNSIAGISPNSKKIEYAKYKSYFERIEIEDLLETTSGQPIEIPYGTAVIADGEILPIESKERK